MIDYCLQGAGSLALMQLHPAISILPATAIATATVDGSPTAAAGAIVFAIAPAKRAGRCGTIAAHIAGTAAIATGIRTGAVAGRATECAPAATCRAGCAMMGCISALVLGIVFVCHNRFFVINILIPVY
jgi:pyruvoyl-dependent arginine decarboxylase (PvlArgDC)